MYTSPVGVHAVAFGSRQVSLVFDVDFQGMAYIHICWQQKSRLQSQQRQRHALGGGRFGHHEGLEAGGGNGTGAGGVAGAARAANSSGIAVWNRADSGVGGESPCND